MSLTAGTRIGPYEIVAPLGAGGMGEVYRARDTRLDRDVAIKILPPAFAADVERLARFEREAKTLASLNHPNIAQIYGIESTEATGNIQPGRISALVMELVEGEDLSARIARGAIPVTEAMAIARQVIDALDAAHERGIIHRDLKPANIKVRDDGTVKVLDFGLAKALAPEGASATADVMNSPTITSPATQLGMILGTAAYMAPEQAKGKPVDKRADVWAFGAVLYEMLTGRRAFPGSDVSETLASVLARDADYSALPADTPASIRSLLRACLQKERRDRLRDIGDAGWHLDASAGPIAAPPAPVSRARSLGWVAAALVLIAAAGIGIASWRTPAPGDGVVVRFVVPWGVAALTGSGPALSPDGRFFVFSDGAKVVVRDLSSFASRPLPGTEGAQHPFVSPDGKYVAFQAGGKLRKVAVAGGDPTEVGAMDDETPGAGWGYDGRIYFSRGWNDAPLVSVPADGGTPSDVSTLDRGNRERGHWWPHPLPDGRHVLFTVWYEAAGLSESKIAALDVGTGTHRVLFPGAMARYAAGHLIYYRAGAHYVVRFDVASMAATGEPRMILPDAFGLSPQGSGLMPVSIAANGTVAYLPGELYPEVQMTWVHPTGRQEPVAGTLRINGSAELSPDGRRVAMGRPQFGSSQVVVLDLVTGGEHRLAASGLNFDPVWSPEGQRLAFTSMRRGDFDIYAQRLDGSPEEAIDLEPVDLSPDAWMPDGRRLVAKEWLSDGTTSVLLLDPATKTRLPLITGPFSKSGSRVSPDGRWLALLANPGGAFHVYVRSLTESGALQQITAGAVSASAGLRWSPRGNRLFYFRGGDLVAATIDEREGRLYARESVVAPLPPYSTLAGVSPDGERVLVVTRVEPATAIPSGFRIILNGLAALAEEAVR
ncbi:MAG TPA: protein kinase [Vicinamibacterales bacterium]|nr:protein kinase [Vicinamibacterales bacterium]